MGPLPPRCGGASPPLPSPVEESSGLLPTVLRGCGFVGAHILLPPSRIFPSNLSTVLCGHGALVRFFEGPWRVPPPIVHFDVRHRRVFTYATRSLSSRIGSHAVV